MPERDRKKSIDLQERDLRLMRGLFDSRVMTLGHASILYFDGKSEAAKKRTQKLKAAGIVRERPRKRHEPSILQLTGKGFEILSDHGCLSEYPHISKAEMQNRIQVSGLTLRHELAIMDVKASICTAVGKIERVKVAEFSTWPLLFQFEASSSPNESDILLKPDGFIRIHEYDSIGDLFEHTFFLEVDRSTETQAHLVAKASCYVDYYRRGGLAVRHGRLPSEFKDFPFRTLIVLQNAERRNNTAESLLMLRPPILSQIWLTTLQEMLADPYGKIWVRPIDYRNATTGTRFEPASVPLLRQYRRQSERESVVEKAIRKQKLLEPDGA